MRMKMKLCLFKPYNYHNKINIDLLAIIIIIKTLLIDSL